MTTYPASTKQIAFIEALISDRYISNGIADVEAFMNVVREQRLTKDGASALIDTLLKQPVDPKPVVAGAEPVPAAPTHRTNNYQGKCGTCGNKVEARTGRIEKLNGRWVTYHLDGQCPQDLQAKLNELVGDLPDGYFAVPYIGRDANRTDLTFLGVRSKANGDRFIVHVVGGHGETDDLSFEWCEKAVAALRTWNLEQAAQVYGQELGHCGRCGRTLTNDASRALGIGPECATIGF